jgi:hypothetical protein
VANKRNVRIELNTFFKKKGYGIISNTNKLAYNMFSRAVNSATNKTQLNSILNKARTHAKNISNLSHSVRNQGSVYGRPLFVLYKAPTNGPNNRSNLVRNVEAFKPSGNLNRNLSEIQKLINRLQKIKSRGEKNIGMMRYK